MMRAIAVVVQEKPRKDTPVENATDRAAGSRTRAKTEPNTSDDAPIGFRMNARELTEALQDGPLALQVAALRAMCLKLTHGVAMLDMATDGDDAVLGAAAYQSLVHSAANIGRILLETE